MGVDKMRKVWLFDVYGTMLPSKGNQIKRKGLDELLSKLKQESALLCIISDAQLKDLDDDFAEAGLFPEIFDHYLIMPKGEDFYTPKPVGDVLKFLNVNPRNVTVVGDRQSRDIDPALEAGMNGCLVPEFKTAEDNEYDMYSLF